MTGAGPTQYDERHDLELLITHRGLLTAIMVTAFGTFDLVSPYGLLGQLSRAGHPGLGWAILISGLTVDLMLAMVLDRTGKALVRVRLLSATIESIAITGAVATHQYGAPASGGVARAAVLMSEIGIRYKFAPALARGVVLALATTVGAAWCAHLAGEADVLAAARCYVVDSTMFAVGPVLLGCALRRIYRRQTMSSYRAAWQRGQAGVLAAELDTRSRLQIGVGGAVADRLQGALWRLSGCGLDARSVAQSLGRHKSAIAERVRDSGAFLDDVLRCHAADARAVQPATARHHFFSISRQDGQTVLTRAQARDIRSQLDQLDLRGEVMVRVVRREHHGALAMVVGEHVVTATPDTPLQPLHIAPAGLGFAAAVQLTNAEQAYSRTPWYVAGLLATLILAVAWCAGRVLDHRGPVAASRLAWCGLLPIACSAVAYFEARQLAIGTRPLLPLATGLGGWGFTTGSFGPLLRRSQIVWLGVAAAMLSTLGMIALLPRYRDVGVSLSTRIVLSELVFGAMALIGTLIVAGNCVRADAALTARVRDELRAQAEQARRRAAAEERRVLAASLEAATRLLREAPDLDLARAAAADVAEARSALDRWAGEPT